MEALELSKVELPEKIRKFIAECKPKYPTLKATLIPALMECQKLYGRISPEVAAAVALEVGLPYGDVASTLSFYTMFLDKPQASEYVFGVCGTWACENAGSKDIQAHFKKRYECDLGDVVGKGLFSMIQVECLADCHNAPSVQVLHFGKEFSAHWLNNMTVNILDKVLDELAAGEPTALRERLVRIEAKANPPDDGRWVWLVTTNCAHPVKVEEEVGELKLTDGYGKLKGLKERNPKLFAEIKGALN